MMHRNLRPLGMLVGWVLAACVCSASVFAQDLPPRTAIDEYLDKPDDTYSWKVVSDTTEDGLRLIVVDMISQTWLSAKDVDRTEWQHWLRIAIPEKVDSNVGFLYISGGSNRPGQQAPGVGDLTKLIARSTGTMAAELNMVPNQPLVFHGDGQRRTEDDLIGYCWDQFLETADPQWLPRNAMVKSAKRAMDTMTAVAASDAGGNQTVDEFVVAGGSKRGWTTWLTGLDNRVVAIVPIVIDVLNTSNSMNHHFAAYGFWAAAIGDYVRHGIMEEMSNPRLAALYRLVDPFYYRHRLTMPKFIVNAAGDQFFLPDSSKFYFDELQGEKHLRYVANADHGLGGSDATQSITAFHWMVAHDRPRPEFSWTFEDDGSIRVVTDEKPAEVVMWQATNPDARDFRVETLGRKFVSTPLEDEGGGVYVARIEEPAEGWSAFFVELTYDVGAAVPLKMTTAVRVTPDTLPYEGKPPSLPYRITIICDTDSETRAAEVVELAKKASTKLPMLDFFASNVGNRCYFNWEPTGDSRLGAAALLDFLEKQKCGDPAIQLESGDEITGYPK